MQRLLLLISPHLVLAKEEANERRVKDRMQTKKKTKKKPTSDQTILWEFFPVEFSLPYYRPPLPQSLNLKLSEKNPPAVSM